MPVVQQPAKAVQADLAAADVRVAIDPGAAWALAVVEMKRLDLLEADRGLECGDCAAVIAGASQGVAGGEQVARVDAQCPSGERA